MRLTRRPLVIALAAWMWIWATGLAASYLPRVSLLRGEWKTSPSPFVGQELWARVTQIFYRADVEHYVRLAREGYRADDSSLVFFPGWPYLLGLLPGAPEIQALQASLLNLGFLILGIWAWQRLANHLAAPRSMWLIAFYPTSVFYAAAYPEAAFLALTGLAAWSLVQDRPRMAAFALALLVSTKHAGLPVATGLVGWALLFRRQAFPLALAGFLVGAIGVLSFYQSVAGDPFAWLHAQAAWNRHLSGPWGIVGDLYGKPVELVLYLALLFCAPVLYARRAWWSWRVHDRAQLERDFLALAIVVPIFVPLWFGSSTQSLYRIVLLGTPALFLLEPLFELRRRWALWSLAVLWLVLNLSATYRFATGLYLP